MTAKAPSAKSSAIVVTPAPPPENKLDGTQVAKAVDALLLHLKRTATANGRKSLFANDSAASVFMTLHLKQIPGRGSNKQIRM